MTLTTVPAEIRRDQWGRPLIVPPTGGRPAPYTRATTLAGAIEDLNGLIKWKVGRAVTGLVDRPDLLLSAAAHRGDKEKLYKICDDALEAGGVSTAATIGTAVHTFTEQLDRGLPVGTVPEPYQADVKAYEAATSALGRLHVEQMMVLDDLRVAGTPDLIVRYQGSTYIADKKTGSIDYPHKMAAQLALYAHSQLYDPATGTRTPIPDIDQQRGIIVHLPAGAGTCTLHWIDIAAGWDAVQLAVQVREWRKRPGLLTPFNDPMNDMHTAFANLQNGGLIGDPIIAELQAASTEQDLLTIWAANETAWLPQHTAAAVKRKKELTDG